MTMVKWFEHLSSSWKT